MSRRLPLILVLVALTAVVVWALVPKRPASLESPADLEPYEFANKLPEVHPPVAALQRDVLDDPVARIASRIEWGPPDVFYWSARHLPESPEARDELARSLLRRLDPVLIGSPLLAKRLIEALAVLEAPAARGTLIHIAEAPPAGADFLQVAAIAALSRYPRDEEITSLFARLSKPPAPLTVQQAAIREVSKSELLADPETLNAYLEMLDDQQAIPFLQQVVARKFQECADACARHLQSSLLRTRQTAILALLVLDDARGRTAAEEELGHDEDRERLSLALSLYRDAQRLPPIARAQALVARPEGPLRLALADALGPWGETSDQEAAVALLRRLADDEDPVVKQAAVAQLWRHGRLEAVESWREQLRHGHGAALREAAQFLCETLRDPLAAPIIRARLKDETLAGADQTNLLSGLRHVGGAEDLPEYIDRLLRAGTAEDVRGSERTYLSEYASLYVQTFGGVATVPLAKALERAATVRAKLAVLDALRGVVRGADADSSRLASEAVFARLLDPDEDPQVRREAIDTIACFDSPALGERLYALRDRVGEKRLADRIIELYASFF